MFSSMVYVLTSTTADWQYNAQQRALQRGTVIHRNTPHLMWTNLNEPVYAKKQSGSRLSYRTKAKTTKMTIYEKSVQQFLSLQWRTPWWSVAVSTMRRQSLPLQSLAFLQAEWISILIDCTSELIPSARCNVGARKVSSNDWAVGATPQ